MMCTTFLKEAELSDKQQQLLWMHIQGKHVVADTAIKSFLINSNLYRAYHTESLHESSEALVDFVMMGFVCIWKKASQFVSRIL